MKTYQARAIAVLELVKIANDVKAANTDRIRAAEMLLTFGHNCTCHFEKSGNIIEDENE